MQKSNNFTAVIADMDGVLTQTADVHKSAWKETFDGFFKTYGDRKEVDTRPFTTEDYKQHVDGKPRYDGVADFLSSRGIKIPRGEVTDPPTANTVCGLGNRKNELFQKNLDNKGVTVFDDAISAVKRWKQQGIPVAVISGSRNCKRILDTAGIKHLFDTIVDGQIAHDLKLDGKVGIISEAASRLKVSLEDTVVIEDSVSGVKAARELRAGLVVGVERSGDTQRLKKSGADRVVGDLTKLRLVQSAAHRIFSEILAEKAHRKWALFLDYDGTLTPIVRNPEQAWLSDEMRNILRELADEGPVAIVSGRDLRDLQSRIKLHETVYAGNHGFEIIGKEFRKTLPEAEDRIEKIEEAERTLRNMLAEIPEAYIERKRFSVAVHYRNIESSADIEQVERAVSIAAEDTELRKRSGKKVFEIEPALDWDKGKAIEWIIDALAINEQETLVIYIGDDKTDEDAFRYLHGKGVGIVVGDEVTNTHADFRLVDSDDVYVFLQQLLTWQRQQMTKRLPA